ncbi:MAG: GHKL domain-containing protein [Clostridiales bacterium]|nr:ATP-binding protein [uncultured Anaerosporobacter sp.]MBS5933829.1 GHKL domain-containing protein [Clostridiales bacterium]
MQKKLMFSYLIIILAAVGISMFASWSKGYNYIGYQREEYHMMQAEMLADIFSEANLESFESFADIYSQKYGVRITIIGKDGTVVADSETTELLENHSTREEVIRALKGEHVSLIRYSQTMDKRYAYSAVPIHKGDFDGVMRISLPVSEFTSLNRNLFGTIMMTVILCMLGATLLAALFTRNLSKPIDDITKAAEGISCGDYETKIYTNDTQQLGRLAEAFNRMSDNLNTSVRALKRRNIEFEAMLKSMASGVIAIDNNDIVMFTNDVFSQMVECSKDMIERQPFYTFMRNAVLFQTITEVRDTKETVMREGTIALADEKMVRVTATPLLKDNNKNLGILLILEDITQIRKLENMRRDFVSNVTHELKTPLTSIRGFVDTLKAGAIKEEQVAARFIDIIDIESERLSSLINDILLLSEIESKEEQVVAPCNMDTVITDVIELLQSKIAHKNVVIVYNPKPDMDYYPANANRMKQLLINLLDNAVKYTEVGTITIQCEKKKNKLILCVEDTGIGMEEEHLGRIFERFYRVDKGRARKTGGTGLGLSIVKHIVERYNGKIKVESKLNKGTKFTIELPY